MRDFPQDHPYSRFVLSSIEALTSDGKLMPKEKFEPPLDEGIEDYVRVLRLFGVETFESCQGGPGHASPVPIIRFQGGKAEGFRALAVAMQHEFPVTALRQVWDVEDLAPTGPCWELTLARAASD